MNHKRIVSNAYIQIISCLLGFHLLFLGTVFLFGNILPKFYSNFPWVQFDFILFIVMLFVLYYFRFTQVKLWEHFFSKMPHIPFKKQLRSIFLRVISYYHLIEANVVLFCVFYFLAIVILILFMLSSSIITLLFEVYWLTDFSFFESSPSIPFLVFGAIFSEIILFLAGLLSTIKE